MYRFKSGENRAEFENGVVAGSFPQLLALGNRLVEEESIEAGEMLRAVMKSFKHAIYFGLPQHLREHQVIVGWFTLLLKTCGGMDFLHGANSSRTVLADRSWQLVPATWPTRPSLAVAETDLRPP